MNLLEILEIDLVLEHATTVILFKTKTKILNTSFVVPIIFK